MTHVNNTHATVKLSSGPLSALDLEEYCKNVGRLDEERIPVIPIKIASKSHIFHKVVGIHPQEGEVTRAKIGWKGRRKMKRMKKAWRQSARSFMPD